MAESPRLACRRRSGMVLQRRWGIVRAQDEPLDVPEYAGDGGEEAEIAGVYIVGPDGAPRRLGFTAANEFSDHEVEN